MLSKFLLRQKNVFLIKKGVKKVKYKKLFLSQLKIYKRFLVCGIQGSFFEIGLFLVLGAQIEVSMLEPI